MLGYSWGDVCYFAGKCSDISWKFVPPWFDFPEIFLFSSDFLVKFESFLCAQIVPTQHHQDLTFNLDFIIKRYQSTAYKEDYNQKLQIYIYKTEIFHLISSKDQFQKTVDPPSWASLSIKWILSFNISQHTESSTVRYNKEMK